MSCWVAFLDRLCFIVRAMKTIVVAVDFSNATEVVMDMAKQLAQSFGAELHLLHVVEPEPSYTAYGFTPNEFPALQAFQKQARDRAADQLVELAQSVKGAVPNVSVKVTEGRPQHCITDYVKEINADGLVLGSHGHGALAALLLGSVAEWMVRKSLVPTLVVPAPDQK